MNEREQILALVGEPATSQFQDREGNWKPFIDANHERNTRDSMTWPIRDLYTTDQLLAARKPLLEEIEQLRLQAITDACQYEEWLEERNKLRQQLSAAQARIAERESGEPVCWESRFLDCSNNPDGIWTNWERVVPRNPYTDTVDDRVAEFRHYISSGYKYELRPLYLRAPQATVRVGWKLVPIEPTEAMVDNVEVKDDDGNWIQVEKCEDIYRAMLAAAPSPEGDKP